MLKDKPADTQLLITLSAFSGEGWAIAQLKDGSYVNRYEEGEPQYRRVQNVVESLNGSVNHNA